MRSVIVFFSAVSALGVALAWRNLAKSSELQLRLVRARELNAHLKEMNHSSRFWAIVERLHPDYKRAEKELKALSARLHHLG